MALAASRRYRVTWLVVVAVFFFFLLSYRGYLPEASSSTSWPQWPSPPDTHEGPEPPGLPLDYQREGSRTSSWCEDRFGTAYLEHARDSQVSYCSSDSASNLTCFWSHIDEEKKPRTEAMCYGRGAVYSAASKSFHLDCELRGLTINETEAGTHMVPEELTRYWYETGPGVIMEKFVGLGRRVENRQTNRTTILLKREGSGNPWHCIMEIMTLTYTLDVLQISVDPDTNEPYLTAKDGETAEIVILDEHTDGPYIDLWKMFAKLPIRRLKDLGPNEPPTNIILPFGGGGNALWQGDWKALECRDSVLLKTFARRVLDHSGVISPKHGEDVAVTFIKRTNTRKLVNETELLDAARKAIPHMKLEEVDFASMTFAEQLAVVQRTDLLAGVHGAGLAHALFLPPGSAVAEILPHNFFHKGFRNVAQLLGNGYFSTHGKAPKEPKEEDKDNPVWQMDAVEIDKDQFIAFIREAVQSLYNKGGRSFDAV